MLGAILNTILGVLLIIGIDVFYNLFGTPSSTLELAGSNLSGGLLTLAMAFVQYMLYRLIHKDVQTIPPNFRQRFY